MANIRLLAILLVVITISVSYFTIVNRNLLNQYSEDTTTMQSSREKSLIHGPMPFDKIASEVSLDVVVKQWSKRGWIPHLPTYLPKNLSLATIYAKVLDGEVGDIIMLVYSSTNDKRIDTSELTLTIGPMGENPIWRITNSSREKIIKVNGLDAYLNIRAPYTDLTGEYYEKYGVDYCIIAEIKINVLYYEYCFAPIFSIDDIIKILESMKPIDINTLHS